jgi:hypothetical protein
MHAHRLQATQCRSSHTRILCAAGAARRGADRFTPRLRLPALSELVAQNTDPMFDSSSATVVPRRSRSSNSRFGSFAFKNAVFCALKSQERVTGVIALVELDGWRDRLLSHPAAYRPSSGTGIQRPSALLRYARSASCTAFAPSSSVGR